MGPRLSSAALRADQELSRISDELDLLLEVTPLDATDAWQRWQATRRTPEFTYRELRVDPDAVIDDLASVPVDEVEDDMVRDLLARCRDHLRRQTRLAATRNTAEFLPRSVELYGGCDDELLDLAESLLARLEPAGPAVDLVPPEHFVERARREIDAYRRAGPFAGTVELREDISSLMVVGRELYVGTDSWLPRHRVDGLVQHEVGTHLFTAETGGRQPLRLLEHGTAGYEETQEALGVLSEHLVEGLDDERLRILAARAVAVRLLVDGAEFGEVFDALVTHRFTELAAWTVTARVFRGGGFTKDVVYLRGLDRLVRHLSDHPIEPLLVGKFHLDDLPTIQSLLDSGELLPAPLPFWLQSADAVRRLETLRDHPVGTWPTEAAAAAAR